MVPNPFLAKVIAKVITSFAKSAVKAYQHTLRKNNQAGKKKFKFDWNDIFKHHKMNILNYLDQSRIKQFNPFDRMQDKVMDTMSKNNSHRISQMEALKILSIDPDTKLTLQFVMEQYLFLYSKNNPESGGSQYIQAKILNAKDMLIEQLGGQQAEQLWRDQNGYHDDEAISDFKKPEPSKEEDGKDKSESEAKAGEVKADESNNKKENIKKQNLEEEMTKKEKDSSDSEDEKEKDLEKEQEKQKELEKQQELEKLQEQEALRELTPDEKIQLLEDLIKKDDEEIKQMQEELYLSSKKQARIKKEIQSFEAEAKKYEEDFPEDFKNHENDELYIDKEIEELSEMLEELEKGEKGKQKEEVKNKKK